MTVFQLASAADRVSKNEIEKSAAQSNVVESNEASGETSPPSPDLHLLYFASLSGQYAPSTIWSKYSLINTVSKTRYNIDLKTYAPDITCYLKKQDANHLKSTKKASVFTSDEVRSFLLNTPSEQGNLRLKVILILGVFGALRAASEIFHILVEDVEKCDEGYHVRFNPAKSRKASEESTWFLIPRTGETFCPASYLDLYLSQVRAPASQQGESRLMKNFKK